MKKTMRPDLVSFKGFHQDFHHAMHQGSRYDRLHVQTLSKYRFAISSSFTWFSPTSKTFLVLALELNFILRRCFSFEHDFEYFENSLYLLF